MTTKNKITIHNIGASEWLDVFLCIPLIALLFFARGPLAIAGFIISIIIYSFNCMLWGGSLAHIGKEVSKNSPPLTYLYSPSSIVFVCGLRCKIASAYHGIPNPIFRCPSTDYTRMAVLGISFSSLPCSSKASTTFCIAGYKTLSKNYNIISAIAQTKPFRPNSLWFKAVSLRQFLSRQNTKFMSSNISITPVFAFTFPTTEFCIGKGSPKHDFAF